MAVLVERLPFTLNTLKKDIEGFSVFLENVSRYL